MLPAASIFFQRVSQRAILTQPVVASPGWKMMQQRELFSLSRPSLFVAGLDHKSLKQQQRKERVRITAPRVRLLGEDGKDHGIVKTQAAFAGAKKRRLQLTEIRKEWIAESGELIPVCKLIRPARTNNTNKTNNTSRKKQEKTELAQKEIRFGSNIQEHDVQIKVKKLIEFIDKNLPTRITIVFKRDSVDREWAGQLLDSIGERVEEIAVRDKGDYIDAASRQVSTVFRPRTDVDIRKIVEEFKERQKIERFGYKSDDDGGDDVGDEKVDK